MKYVITSEHHKHLGEIGDKIELNSNEHALLPFAHYLNEAGMDASVKATEVGSKRNNNK